MKSLIVEDEFSARVLLTNLLADYGECDVAVNGKEAMDAFAAALDSDEPYDLVCLDIMMPEMNGHETLEAIRHLEESKGIMTLDGVKIIMTTALSDSKNIFKAFRNQCEAYLVKPIMKDKLVEAMKSLDLV